MKRLRTLIFWSHLLVGATAGIVILVMSATGAALALKPQIVRFVDRHVRVVSSGGDRALPPSQLLAAVTAARPGATVASIAIDRDPSSPAIVTVEGRTIYVDPYTGRVLGDGSTTTQAFFRTIENWHRWLGVAGEGRAMARSITGAANLGFLALAASGVYLWWPRKWTAQHARPILAFRRATTGRARDFNWHNVIGFWCAPAIVVMTATGAVMSYPWANDLLYRATGSPLPARPGSGANAAAQGGRGARPSATDRQPGEPRRSGHASAPSSEAIDRAWAAAAAQMPAWSAITMRVPTRAGGPIALTLSDGRRWNAFARSQLTVDSATGAVQQWQPYEASSLGQKARGWVRFGHTGELAGVGGQIVAGIACLGGTVLVWTGLTLAIRRFLLWRSSLVLSLRKAPPQMASAGEIAGDTP